VELMSYGLFGLVAPRGYVPPLAGGPPGSGLG
jgi:hypothetical protein